MSGLMYEIFTSTTLLTLGLYHLTSSTLHHLKHPTTFTAKPFHPLPTPKPHLRLLPLYLTALSLLLSSLLHLLSSSSPDPLLPLHPFTSLQSSSLSLLFLLLSLTPLTPLPDDIVFAASSAAFYLLSSTTASHSSAQSSDLEAHLLLISSHVSLASSLFALLLAFSPKLFLADISLSSSVCLQGLWALQTGLTLHVDGFIPEGCHKLLDVVGGIEGSTKCELDASKMRAKAILDLMFVVYVFVVVVMVFVVYGVVAKAVGGSRRSGAYEALPTGGGDGNGLVQLKTLTGTQA